MGLFYFFVWNWFCFFLLTKWNLFSLPFFYLVTDLGGVRGGLWRTDAVVSFVRIEPVL